MVERHIDLTGQKFHHWTAMKFVAPRHWECQCKCGIVRVVRTDGLFTQRSQSCGCWGRKQWSKQAKLHNTTHGLSKQPIYYVWKEIKARCYRKTHARYADYGGRGIRMDWFWHQHPELFIAWALRNGYQPGLVIDRIDNNESYLPQNCRFVTYAVSNTNKRQRKDSRL